jgi:membrane protein
VKLPGFIARPLGLQKGTAMDPRVRVLRDAAIDAEKSRLPQMAAALSYRTIFGILPVLALGLVVLKGFVDQESVRSIVNRAIAALGLDRIAIDPRALEPAAATEDFVGPMPLVSREVSASLDVWINQVVRQVDQINVRAIGAVGVVLLIYAAISMIVEIERAFNQIYRVPVGRSWTRRLTNYTTLIVYAPICLFLTFYLGQRFGAWTQELLGSDRFSALATPVITLLALGQIVASTALLLVLYTVVPNTKVRLLPAIGGALVAALVFEGLKFGFVEYVNLSAKRSYARLYGSLALIPLFLLWIYLTWMVVLFGLQVTYQLQHGRFKTRATPILDFDPTLVDPAAAVVVMNAVARGFVVGKTHTASSLARATGLSEGPVQMIVARLADRGLLNRVERRDDQDETDVNFALARAPSTIFLADILTAGFELAGGDQPSPGCASTLAKVRKAQIDAMGGLTLAQSAELPSAEGRTVESAGSPASVPLAAPAAPTPIISPPQSFTAGRKPG